MLPRENRLKKKRDFETVFKQGKGFRQDLLFLKVFKNDSEHKRFGFVVSRKVSKKAVVRNKIKRRLRDTTRERLQKIRKGVDCILVALPGIEEKEFVEMEKGVDKLFEKASILNKVRGER